MIREQVSELIQKKYFIMFFTSVIYITGLFAYFLDKGVIFASILMLVGVFSIIKNFLSPKLVLFGYLTFFFAFFNAGFRIKNSDILYQIAPQNAVIQGQIVSIPAKNDKRIRFFFNVNQIKLGNDKVEKVNAKTLVNIYASKIEDKEFNIGDNYSLQGKLRAPFSATNPSQFDYGKYLKNFNTYTVFYSNGNNLNKLEEELSLKWRFLQGLNNIRNDIIKTHSTYLKSPNLEILGGIVFGDDAVSPPDFIKKSFVNSGLLHILAASGMNVAIIYGIWFFILSRFKTPFNITVTSGIFVVIFYSLMTGLGPSVIRATFMLIFILIGKLIDRDAHSISLLSFVGLLMLIYNPAYINDVGFQLSFLVTFGLLIMTPAIFSRLKSIPNWLSGAIFIPIIAQIWVAPIQMFYFNSFSLYSVFANIAILPFVSIISFGGFISSVLSLIKPISGNVCYVFDFLLNPTISALVFISDYFANLPRSLLTTTQPSVLQIFLYYSIILLITALIKWGKSKNTIIATILLTIILLLTMMNFQNNKLETIAFDVQNADAFLIKTPQGKYFIIDSGKTGYKGAKTQAKLIILEYLKDKGIKNIEGLIITHFDSDHAGGAIDLIENLKIKKIYVNSLTDDSNLAKKIYKAGKNKKINVVEAINNQTIYSEDNLSIKTLRANLNKKFENENSIITIVSNRKFDELFMGDAGILAYEKIKPNLPDKIEILKVGHHGAKNVVNKKMLIDIKPEYAIISTGLNNYGHPNLITLSLLKSQKTKTLRTDKQNSIKIEAIDSEFKVYGYNKKQNAYLKIE